MSVVATHTVLMRRFRGFADPAMPAGQWSVFGSATGNAGGGVLQQFLEFQIAGLRDSRMFSLEQINVSIFLATPTQAMIEVINMGEPSDVTGTIGWSVATTSNGSSVSPLRSIAGADLAFLPIWMGAKSVESVASSLLVEMDNVDGATVGVHAAGYWWSSRAVNADGGPQRPPGRIFGH